MGIKPPTKLDLARNMSRCEVFLKYQKRLQSKKKQGLYKVSELHLDLIDLFVTEPLIAASLKRRLSKLTDSNSQIFDAIAV